MYIPIDSYYDYKTDKLHYIVKHISKNKKITKIAKTKNKPTIEIRTAPFTKKIIYFLEKKYTQKETIDYKTYLNIKKMISCVYKKKPIKYKKRSILNKYKHLITLKKEIYNDFKVETQFLQNEKFTYPDNYFDYINIGVWDIEVKHNESEFPEPEEAKFPINSISIYNRKNKNIMLYLLIDKKYHTKDKLFYKEKIYNTIKENFNDIKINIYLYENENKLIKDFLKYISLNIDILLGWFSVNFDTLYLYNRCKKLNLNEYFQLAFGEIFKIINVVEGKQGTKSYTYYTTKTLSIDYINLIKFFEGKKRPSYKLKNISGKVLKNENIKIKTKLEIGSINSTYENNIINFCLYNVNDVMLVEYIDRRLLYLQLLFKIKQMTRGFSISYLSINTIEDSYISNELKKENLCCITTIKAENYYKNKIWNIYKKVNYLTSRRLKLINNIREKYKDFSLFLTEDELVKIESESILDSDIKINNNKKIKINKNQLSFLFKKSKYPGGYVMKPKPNIYLNVIDFDAQSLYPSIIYSLNASHETWIYQIPENIALKLIYERNDLINYLKNNNFKIPIYDVRNDIIKVFTSKEFINIIKLILEKELVISEIGAIFIPAHIKEGQLRKLIKKPINERIEIKSIMKKIKKEKRLSESSPEILTYDTAQKSLKVIANALYGFQGYKRARLFNIILATSITLFGQFLIRYSGYRTDNIIK